jgi:predicted outer membrane protein
MRTAAIIPMALAALMLVVAAPGAVAADKAAFDAAYATANAARKGAAKLGYEWSTTKKLLEEAEEMAGEGNFADAVALAEQARFQGEAAQYQAREQAAIWQSFVVK